MVSPAPVTPAELEPATEPVTLAVRVSQERGDLAMSLAFEVRGAPLPSATTRIEIAPDRVTLPGGLLGRMPRGAQAGLHDRRARLTAAPWGVRARPLPEGPGRDALRALCAALPDAQPEGLDATLRSYQQAGLRWLRFLVDMKAGGVLADEMGLGKFQRVDEPILTPEGWKPIGSLRLGDKVIDPDGGTAKITGVYPQGEQDLFTVTMSDGGKTTSGRDHLWSIQSAVRKHTGHPPHVRELHAFMDDLHQKTSRGDRFSKWFIPIMKPAEFSPPGSLPLHPYLLGVLLGDGGMTGTSVFYTKPDLDLHDMVTAVLPEEVYLEDKGKGTYRFAMVERFKRENPIVKALRDLDLMGSSSLEKFIPLPYLRAAPSERLLLLQGLMDTDGECSQRGCAIYNTSSARLKDDVIELARSLGGIANVYTRLEPVYTHRGEKRTGHQAWRVNVRLPTNPFRLARKGDRWHEPNMTRAIVAVEPAGRHESVCIAVSSQRNLYVTRDHIVTHNTVQTTALLCSIKETDKKIRALVIAPTSVVPNWKRELGRFAPSLTVHVWHGNKRRSEEKQLKEADVIVSSYGLLRQDETLFSSLDLDVLILDEAQVVKNHRSHAAQAAKRIRARTKLCLTGTPVENKLADLWSLFDVCSTGLLDALPNFTKRFAVPIGQGDRKAAAGLKRIIHPYLLRRTKAEVLKELPKKIETDFLVEMSEAQKKIYASVLAEVRRDVFGQVDGQGIEKSQMHILSAFTKLRQVAADPRLVDQGRAASSHDSGKLQALRQLIDECLAGGEKILVFSQFTTLLRLIRKTLDQDEIAYAYLDGETKERGALVDQFQAPDGPSVFLLSLKAGGTGLNLTAASSCVLIEPWFNPAVEDQATDRCHRMGQEKSVNVYRLIAEGTIEEKILIQKGHKRDLAKAVLSEDSGGHKAFSRADLEELLS